MQLPLVGVPTLIRDALEPYREVFCREAGFEHVSRYVTGLLLSPNKTLQGIYAQQVWPDKPGGSRRAMHAAVFEAGWDSEGLLPRHRAVVAAQHRGRGLEVLGLDWTYVHHDRGPAIYATKRAYDHVEGRMSTYQTVVTAVVANAEVIDGVAVDVQFPNYQSEEVAYLNMTASDPDPDLESARQRVIDLLHYHKNRLSYRKRTEIALEIARQLEAEGRFPHAPYAFDQGVLSVPLTQFLEQHGKHWVSEVQSSRLVQWQGQWCRADGLNALLCHQCPESFRALTVRLCNGEEKTFWVFTKAV